MEVFSFLPPLRTLVEHALQVAFMFVFLRYCKEHPYRQEKLGSPVYTVWLYTGAALGRHQREQLAALLLLLLLLLLLFYLVALEMHIAPPLYQSM